MTNYCYMNIIENALMKDYTSFKVGGPADRLVIPETEEELIKALELPRPLILGNGSNTIFTDAGYRGTVIRLGRGFSEIKRSGNCIVAGAAALLPAVSRFAAEEGLCGLEFACGIPGSIGGAMCMNAGAYGHSLSELLCGTYAEGVTAAAWQHAEFSDASAFGYRKSPFEDGNTIVTKVTLTLKPGEPKNIRALMAGLTAKRVEKQPLSYPSAGSFFKRPEGYFAGKLIEDAGLKGFAIGGAQVSVLHAGFIINKGGASASDVINLMHHVQNEVFNRFGVMLEPEVRIIEE